MLHADSRLQALLGGAPGRMNANDEIAIVSQQMPGNAPIRHAVLFQWQDVLQTDSPSSASDAVYELASVLVAIAVWRQRRAVYLCQGGKTGTNSDAAIKVCNTCTQHCHCALASSTMQVQLMPITTEIYSAITTVPRQ